MAWHLAWSAETSASRKPERSAQGIESIWITKRYAERWSAMGRWIAQRAAPSDWMVVGAAGAMPYFAGISNLDLLGVNDAYIAHEGRVIGSRPGHHRGTRLEYTLSKRPVFPIEWDRDLGGDSDQDQSHPPRRSPKWEAVGYVWTEARLSPEHHAAPRPFLFHFLLRRDRALELRARHDPEISIADFDTR